MFSAGLAQTEPGAESTETEKPQIAIVLSGGGSRGLAHIGVLKWLEENRIPVDLVVGTSMGGIVGGAYSAGLSPSQLESLAKNTDWGKAIAFGAQLRNSGILSKEADRDLTSLIEFGIDGLNLPRGTATGFALDQLADLIGFAFPSDMDFDRLPTRFRTVAADLVRSEEAVLSRGNLADALRATASIPGILPPVKMGDQVLVDGGIFNNLPTDVARNLGSRFVLAVDVGPDGSANASDLENYPGVLSQLLNAVTAANVRRNLKLADLVISPSVGDIDWLNFDNVDELIQRGYAAAEARGQFLRTLSVSQEEYDRWLQERRSRIPAADWLIDFIEAEGVPSDAAILRALRRLIGERAASSTIFQIIEDIVAEGGWESVRVSRIIREGGEGLLIRFIPIAAYRPVVRPQLRIEGTTEQIPNATFALRLRAQNLGIERSQAQLDLAIGLENLAAVRYQIPFADSSFYAGINGFHSIGYRNEFIGDRQFSMYRTTRSGGGGFLGVTTSRFARLELGYQAYRVDFARYSGPAILPPQRGTVSELAARFEYNDTNSSSIPTKGSRVVLSATRVFEAPGSFGAFTQLQGQAQHHFPVGRSNSFFLRVAGGGVDDNANPELFDFSLGGPLNLSAWQANQLRGQNFLLGQAGYLHTLAELPPILGTRLYSFWILETGSAYDRLSSARFYSSISGGFALQTPLGPFILGGAYGSRGFGNVYFLFGRPFR
ncbi:MAG: patatin-like phospholipase family protein [Fimbriimonadaceae bacterium]